MTVLEMYLWISAKLASERYYTTMQFFNGLSTNIARKYPWADPYQSRTPLGKRNLAPRPEQSLYFTLRRWIPWMLLFYMRNGISANEI